MIDDPIVEEVYHARQRILDKWQGDLGKWVEHLRDSETRHAGRVVTLEMIPTTDGRQQAGAAVVANWEREGLLGTHSDIADPAAHARDLREQAEKRERA
jgi:hypothetical protein